MISPLSLFQFLNNKTGEKNYITAVDFQSLFDMPFPSLRQVIRTFDKDNDFALNQKEFSSFIIPRFITDISINDSNQVSSEAVDTFISLLKEEIDMIESLNSLIRDIKNSKDFTIYEAFIAIANDLKYINEEKLQTYLMKGNKAYTDIIYNEDIANIIYRFDRDGDSVLNYEEFKDIFFPYVNEARITMTSSHNRDNSMFSIPEKTRNNYTEIRDDFDEVIPKGHLYFNYSLSEFPNEEKNNKTFDLGKHNRIISRAASQSMSLSQSMSHASLNASGISSNTNILPLSVARNDKETLLLNLFKEIVHNENKIEREKENLSRMSEINLPDLFAIFDIDDNAFVSISGFMQIMQDYFDIKDISEDSIVKLYKKYDTDMDNRLSYREFCEMILPKKIEYARMMISHRPPEQFLQFSINANNSIKKTLLTLIEAELNIEKKQMSLCAYKGFSCYECFEAIKNKSSSYIYRSDLKNYLARKGINLLPFELDLIMMRMHSSSEGEISFNDFLRALIPQKQN